MLDYIKRNWLPIHAIGFILFMTFLFTLIYNINYGWSYYFFDIITKLFTGIAPFAAAFGAYLMWSKNIEHKNTYDNLIINKRMEAYINLLCFINKLRKIKTRLIVIDNTEHYPCNVIDLLYDFSNTEDMNKLNKINETYENDFNSYINENYSWYSEEIKKDINSLNNIINKIISNKIYKDHSNVLLTPFLGVYDPNKFVQKAIDSSKEIITLIDNIEKRAKKDVSSFIDVDKFLDNN